MEQLVPRPIVSIYNETDANTNMNWLLWFDQLQKKINELVESNAKLVTEIESLKE